ncbi:MAG TPA: glycosyltransferase [Pyrinomonadaceae bacterium]|nr:glycosyltransferase [Pyrinomonadaceae bacterium]
MKRVVISAYGSFGDVHPYVAIALELKRRGHHPVVATAEIYREKMEALGLELHPVRPDMPGWDQPEEARRMLTQFLDPRKGTERVFRWLLESARASYEDLLPAARAADLFFTHPLPFVNATVAEKACVPWVSSVLAPGSFLSVYDPPVPPQWPAAHKLLKRSPLVSRALMRVARAGMKSWVKPVARLRAELGLRPGANPVMEGQHSPRLVLALFSPLIAEPQPDWPPNTRVTGFCFYDRRDRAGDAHGLAPEISEFLDASEPPLVFTLGSAAFWAAEDFYGESARAAQALGVRALLLIGDERYRPAALPDAVAAFEYAPYGELLPRARAVVHHGGAGTCAQVLRAGVPSLVMPFSHDQFDNGARLVRLGAARVLPRSKYNAATAARELRALLGDESYTSRAAEAGRRVSAEDGTAAAADALEEVLRG